MPSSAPESPLESPRGAARLARSLLPPLGDRWLHTQGVAERARELSRSVPDADRELLVAAAWLHDIGYAPQLRDSGFHPLDGARYLASLGADGRLVRLVAHHSGAAYEAEQRGLSAELAVYEREESAALDALTCADMTTGPAGQRLSFPERIDEILTRYAPGSEVHTAISAALPYLAAAVARADAGSTDQPM
ncbi:HD domain-containing protein [Streptomyces sp. NPDC058682]|uniref:HD domain-containing protein n=1 Tax=unclassified Streptomyces TaxID=2593676 RepID=UPI0022515D44|nr:HD domain-containing protein [Streptomyces sp. NBC_01214]MCX4805863.1 HD domain-containing protein [Streptomyces sp. NBC_01214]